MPPQGKRPRTAASGSAAGTRPGAAAAAEEQREVAKERGLQPALVKDFLSMVQRRNRLGPDFSATMR